jgi:hypothetical protein
VTANQTTVVLLFNPFATRQLQDLGLGQLRHDAEVVGVEVLFDREVRVLDPGRDRVGRTRREFGFGQPEQKLSKRLIGGRGVAGHRLELLAHCRQTQLSEMSLE